MRKAACACVLLASDPQAYSLSSKGRVDCNMFLSDGMAPSSSQSAYFQHTPVVANAGRRSVVLQVLGGANVTPGNVGSVSRNNRLFQR